ncbi:MAG: RagB/SusD family nutrient uptake outer membrane protein, partial [Bacteroidales bacterium]
NEKNADGKYKNFVEETAGRDQRLCQTIRGADYTRKNAEGDNERTAPNYSGHTLTGYQFTKYVLDDISFDDAATNYNDIPIFRFAEALLNYAEAKAELGTITDSDWQNTIGALRRRAGITGGDLDTKPTAVDTYLQKTFYPKVSDPVILEIRRDRAIELCLEGLRLDDLKRWNCGNLWEELPWTGVYIPALDTPLDMNGDGVKDVYVTKDKTYKGDYKGIAMFITGAQEIEKLSDDPNGGYILNYNMSRKWNDNMYLYPIPSQVIRKNEALSQNPGW